MTDYDYFPVMCNMYFVTASDKMVPKKICPYSKTYMKNSSKQTGINACCLSVIVFNTIC